MKRLPQTTLTKKQEAFVQAFVDNGGRREAAATAAGYTEKAASSISYRMMRLPHIQQAIHAATGVAFGAHAARALHQVVQLVSGAKSDYVKLEAAKDILDRAGFKASERITHQVDGNLSVHIDIGPGPADRSGMVVDVTPTAEGGVKTDQ